MNRVQVCGLYLCINVIDKMAFDLKNYHLAKIRANESIKLFEFLL